MTTVLSLLAITLAAFIIGRHLWIKKRREAHEIALIEKEIELRSNFKEMMSELNSRFGKCDVDITLQSGQFHNLLPQNHILFYHEAKVVVIGCQPISYSDIINFNIVDNPISYHATERETNNNNMLRRAFSGGLLFGSKGAMVGAITSDTYSYTTTYTRHAYKLYVNIANISKPLISIPIGDDTDVAELLRSMFNLIIHNNTQIQSVQSGESVIQ